MTADSKFLLLWRGISHGPWTDEEIQKRLSDGEIHSLFQIQVAGEWMPLREHLEKTQAASLQQRALEMAARIRQQESEKPETERPNTRGGRLTGQVKRPDPFANPPPVFTKSATQEMHTRELLVDEAQTCWLAVIAFVVSCCSFVPYLNLVSWLPSLVLGHLALLQIQRNPALEGRGLAVGALIIAYAMLVFAGLCFLWVPSLFFRVFPIAG